MNRFVLFLRVSVVWMLLFVMVGTGYAQTNATLILASPTLSVGETGVMEIHLDCGSLHCTAVQITLTYDPAIIRVDSMALGSYLGEQTFVAENKIDNQAGEIHFAATSMGNSTGTNTDALLTLTITAVSTGQTQFNATRLNIGDLHPLTADFHGGDLHVRAVLQATPTIVSTPPESNITNTDYALQFDGNNDFVSIVNTGSFNFTHAFTVEAWIKPISLESTGKFAGIVQGAFTEPPFTGGGWVMFLDPASYSSWGLSVCVPNCNSAQSSSNNLQVNQWQHVAATYNNKELAIYRNGALVSHAAQSGTVMLVKFILFGTWENSFDGVIDEVRIWNVARSAAEIQAGMNTPLTGSETGLVGYWRFNEGSGQTAFDSSSNGNNGKLGSLSGIDDHDPIWVPSDVPLG